MAKDVMYSSSSSRADGLSHRENVDNVRPSVFEQIHRAVEM